ncbi:MULTISPECIES: recombinase family protein [Flagellimonas]|uniref:Recombinase family protein n=1 Tax=Flagellimonas aurea TaxID=2915619 RepID=A0ABS3G9Z1_9FLAO|nr:hypothetical protein [Allomuricauda sp.]MBO0356250.1 recombinase family protein [Allomuricauda aurea]UBZ16058.1 recombinase family protein [Allomuricauda aquimarina]
MCEEGDTIVVYKLDRIDRSLSHLTKLIEYFEMKENPFNSQTPSDSSYSLQSGFYLVFQCSIIPVDQDIFGNQF